MNKNEGLTRLAKFVHYTCIVISALILMFPIRGLFVNDYEFDVTDTVIISLAVIIYLIGKGISWIIEGFAKN